MIRGHRSRSPLPTRDKRVRWCDVVYEWNHLQNGNSQRRKCCRDGEGRRHVPPIPPTDPRDEEGVPTRGTSPPLLSCDLTGVMSSKETDFRWNGNRILYARFGYLHLLGTNPPNQCPMILGFGDSLESTSRLISVWKLSARLPCPT